MKVFYQDMPRASGEEPKEDPSTEEVLLPLHIVDHLIHELERSRAELPESAQTLGVWKVGALERWDPERDDNGYM